MTACYILIVPLLALFFKKKCGWNIWVGVVIALVGLYLLCIQGRFVLRKPDVLLLLCAFCFSVQILLVDHFSPKEDGVRLAAIQFFTCGVLGIIPMFLVGMKHSYEGFAQWILALSTWNAIRTAHVWKRAGWMWTDFCGNCNGADSSESTV